MKICAKADRHITSRVINGLLFRPTHFALRGTAPSCPRASLPNLEAFTTSTFPVLLLFLLPLHPTRIATDVIKYLIAS